MTERVQKMARINVDPAAWGALRVQALQHNRSLADILGELIEQTVSLEPPVQPAPHPAKATRHPRLKPAAEPGGPQDGLAPVTTIKRDTGWVPPWEE